MKCNYCGEKIRGKNYYARDGKIIQIMGISIYTKWENYYCSEVCDIKHYKSKEAGK